MTFKENKPVIIFDGICNLCNASVKFLTKHDRKNQFSFVSLQSDAANKILLHFKLKNDKLNSIIYIDNNTIYYKSTAVLKILKKLNGIWKLSYVFMIVPTVVRDAVYDFIARNRYNWFGVKDNCETNFIKKKY